MAKTRADLISEVLDILGVAQSGQDIAAEDYEAVDRKIDPRLAELAEWGLVSTIDDDDVDLALFLPLAELIASSCAAAFGVTQLRGLSVEEFDALAERRLRRVVSASGRGFTATAQYF